jgi:hypothetical protein
VIGEPRGRDRKIGSAVVEGMNTVGGVDTDATFLRSLHPCEGREVKAGEEPEEEMRKGDVERVGFLFHEFMSDLIKDAT